MKNEQNVPKLENLNYLLIQPCITGFKPIYLKPGPNSFNFLVLKLFISYTNYTSYIIYTVVPVLLVMQSY